MVIDRICENNLHLKFTPIIMNNFNIGLPRFSVEKTYGNYQFTASTDIASSSFEFSEYNEKKFNKNLRVMLEQGSIGLIPKVEWQVAHNLRFFVQLTSSFSFGGKEGSSINISQAIAYGYKLQLAEDLKLELTSSFGYPNYFQIGIINSKFRASIPFATSEGSTTNF